MEIILIAVVGALNIACFFIGAKVGQMVAKGEEVKITVPNPLEAIREHSEKKAVEREQDRVETIMRNIERYDGTPDGQEEVPRG